MRRKSSTKKKHRPRMPSATPDDFFEPQTLSLNPKPQEIPGSKSVSKSSFGNTLGPPAERESRRSVNFQPREISSSRSIAMQRVMNGSGSGSTLGLPRSTIFGSQGDLSNSVGHQMFLGKGPDPGLKRGWTNKALLSSSDIEKSDAEKGESGRAGRNSEDVSVHRSSGNDGGNSTDRPSIHWYESPVYDSTHPTDHSGCEPSAAPVDGNAFECDSDNSDNFLNVDENTLLIPDNCFADGTSSQTKSQNLSRSVA